MSVASLLLQALSISSSMLKHEIWHCSCTVDKMDPKKPIYCDVPFDSVVIDAGFSAPYHPCRVTLTQSILDIKIHQATGAVATECHIPECEWQPLMHGSPAWCPARTLGRPLSALRSRMLASWRLALQSCWSLAFITVVKATILAPIWKCSLCYCHGIY